MTNLPAIIDRRYQVLAQLGSGLSGEIYKVQNTQGVFALKLLRTQVEGLQEEELVSTFKFEFSLLKDLNHPNIVGIFDFGFDPELKRFYFTQEFVEGSHILQASQRLSLGEIQSLLIQALQGLAYLHSQNLIHGDLKPDNLLISEKGEKPVLKIIDFGISHPSLVKRGGTPAYMAPEKILKEPIDTRSDLYSLGVVFYAALTGKNPFGRKNALETLQAHLKFTPPSATLERPELDPVWSELIGLMLQKNPRLRISSAEACLRFLETKGDIRSLAKSPLSLPQSWIARPEILKKAKDFLKSTSKQNRILLILGEEGLGKSTLLTEMKYEAELQGIEVLTGEARATREHSVLFLPLRSAEDLPDDGTLKRWLEASSIVLTAAPHPGELLAQRLSKFLIQTLHLRPLSLEETRQFLQETTRNPKIPEPFLEALHTLSRGKPATLLEALRHLLMDPLIVDSSGKWNLSVFEEGPPSFEQLGLSEQALSQALEGETIADPVERWFLNLQRATVWAQQGQLEEALKLLKELEQALEASAMKARRLEARAGLLEKRGWIYTRQGRYHEARESFAAALSLLAEGEGGDEALVLKLKVQNFISFLNLQEGRLSEAIEQFQASAKEAQKLSPSDQRKISNNELAQACMAAGLLQEAVRRLKEDLEFFKSFPGEVFLMKTHYNLGEAYSRQKSYPDAYQSYSRVAEIAKKERNWEYLLRAYNGLGNIASLQGDRDSALDFYQRGLGLAEYLRDYFSAATVAQNRGVILSELNRLEEAFYDLDLSKSFLTKVTPSSHTRYLMARVTLELGEVYRKKKNFSLAQSYFNEALSRSEEDANLKHFRFYPLASLATLALAQRDLPGFQKLYPQLLHLASSTEEKQILADLVSQSASDLSSVTPSTPVLEKTITKVPTAREISMTFQGEFPQDALAQILKINRALITEHNPQSLLRKILQYASELSGAESALLIEVGEEGGFEVREAFNMDLDQAQKEISQQVARRVLESGESIVTHDAQSDEGFSQFQSVVALNLRSIACIPIRVHQKIIGLLYLSHRYQNNLFDNRIVNALEAFGDQAGLALQNSRYVLQLERQNRQLYDKLEDAEEEIDRLKTDLRTKIKNPYPKILGKSRALVEILRLLDRISDTNLSILIVGETGSGKELVARSIHENSRRRAQPFVAVNCGAIPENLIESELFGHRAGAFTGAIRDKKGLIEEADGGTLFLDEIGELPLNTQVKLLRAVQEKEIQRLGETRPTPVDIRILAATHRQLEVMVSEGKFREDLYYRVAQMVLSVPPLRERKEDLILLCEYFLKQTAQELKSEKIPRLGKDLLTLMMEYDWPGNIRELENFIRTAAAFAERGVIHLGTLPDFLRKKLKKQTAPLLEAKPIPALSVPPGKDPERSSVLSPDFSTWTWEQFEKVLFAQALLRCGMNCEKVAEQLGVGIATVYLKMRRFQLKLKAHQYEHIALPYPELLKISEFKRRLIQETYSQTRQSPYETAKRLRLNVGTIYRYLDKAPEEKSPLTIDEE